MHVSCYLYQNIISLIGISKKNWQSMKFSQKTHTYSPTSFWFKVLTWLCQFSHTVSCLWQNCFKFLHVWGEEIKIIHLNPDQHTVVPEILKTFGIQIKDTNTKLLYIMNQR